MADKWVYRFGGGKAEGRASMRDLLGGKGANLAEMSSLGLPVPPGFTITTDVCTAFYKNDRKYPDGLEKEVEAALAHVEKEVGAKFGDAKNPLLVSVRSGARASMPGMMDTVLNLGLNDDDGEGADRAVGRPALRLRFLSPLHPDVCRRRAGRRAPPVRGAARRAQAGEGLPARHRPQGRGLEGARRPVQGAGARRSWASPSRRSRATSCGAPSARSSEAG